MKPFWRITRLGPMDIGANALVLEHRSIGRVVRILIDYGIGLQRLPSGDDVEIFPDEYNRKLHAIVFTHAHLDHSGLIPRIIREHPEAELIVSEKTLKLANIMWWDAWKIHLSRKREALEAGKDPDEIEEPMFYPSDIRRVNRHPKLVLVADDGEAVSDLPGLSGWKFTTWPAGHASGAQCYRIDPPVGRPIFGTGDIALHDQETAPGFSLPDSDGPLGDLFAGDPIMVCEATNGDRDPVRSRSAETARFIERVLAVRDREGVVLCPAFTYARSANIALKCVDAEIPVYLDGLARKFAREEIANLDDLLKSDAVRFMPYPSEERSDWRKLSDSEKKRLWEEAREFRAEVARGEHGFAVIICGGAVMDQGWAAFYEPIILPERLNACFLTGHVFENTLAETVRDASPGDTVVVSQLKGPAARVPLWCEVEEFDFSSHIYQSDIIRLVEEVNPAHLVLHHGEATSLESVAEGVADSSVSPEVHAPDYQEPIELN